VTAQQNDFLTPTTGSKGACERKQDEEQNHRLGVRQGTIVAQSLFLPDIEFQLSGNLSELERLANEVGKFCAGQGFEDEVGFELNLVLEELFMNSIRHGGCEGIEGCVSVKLRRAEGREVVVTYADRGRPFNPLDAAPAKVDLPLAERVPGGLGIHLVRRIMKDLEYDRLGEWNRLTMRLRAPEGTCCS